jgi:endonuclease YncB( thermonuclease family)
MLCLAGTFPIAGTEPDGDSVRFRPANPADWSKVPGSHQVHTNATGAAQLRADAIDALETHYAPPGGHNLHQPIALADAAAAELLDWLGFTGVVRDGEKVTAVDNDGQPGFILTRGADKYGRCVALIGRGDAPVASGRMLRVGLEELRETANHELLRTGLAYPTYYSNLYIDLRAELTDQVATARQARTGVFADDRTEAGVTVESLATLTDEAVILPKLFRRLADYLQLNGDDPSLAGFEDFLRQQDDELWVIPTGQKTGLDNLVGVSGQTVKLKRPPEELVFEEK